MDIIIQSSDEYVTESDPLISVRNAGPTGERAYSYACKTFVAFLIVLPLISLGLLSNATVLTDQLLHKILSKNTEDSGRNTHHQHVSPLNQSHLCVVSANQTSEDRVQKQTADFKFRMQIGSYLTAFLTLPLWGLLSDHKGRHFAVLVISAGSIFSVVPLLTVSINPHAPLWILILGETLYGTFGRGSYGCVAAAIVADRIPKGKRVFLMIITDFSFQVSKMIVQFGSGYWIQASGFTPMLLACLVMHIVLLCYGLLVLPKLDMRAASGQNEGRSIVQRLKHCLAYPREHKDFTRACILLLFIYAFVEAFAKSGMDFLFIVYSLGPPLCWDSVMLGTFKGMRVALHAMIPFLVGLAMIKLEPSPWLIFAGLLGGVISNVIYGLARNTVTMFVGVVFLSPTKLVNSVSRSYLADLTPPQNHDVLFL